ncbi:MAG: signal peptidase II, partial [Elusimicrobiota bacterium]|nr:signal peptidase II [Elusimicrobiota bacterium]
QNPGIAFGLFQNEQYSNIFFILISIAIIFAMFFWYEKILQYGRNLACFGVTLIYAGAIGNLIDRIFFGKVIDFIDLHFWPVFNIADSSITVGGIILFLSFCRFSRKPDGSDR